MTVFLGSHSICLRKCCLLNPQCWMKTELWTKHSKYNCIDRNAEIKSPSVQGLKVLLSFFSANVLFPLSEYNHACFTHYQNFVACSYFYLVGPLTVVFSPQSAPYFYFTALVLANAVACMILRNKIGHPVIVTNGLIRFLWWVPTQYK